MSGFQANASTYLLPEDVPPSAWTGHVPFAFWITEAMAPATFVELGTHHGTSFLAFCQAIAARRLPTQAFAVDTWEGDEHAGFYGDDVHQQLDATVRAKYAGFAQLMRMRFDDALGAFSDGSIDLLHIDGLHTYEAVKHDFESWLPKMSRRGVVLFHDTVVRERGFGVWKLWEELSARYPAFGFRHTHGLGVLLVGEQPPEALRALCALQGSEDRQAVERAFEALGQRVVQRARADYFEAKYEDAEKFRVHYKAVFERAEAALAEAQATEAALRAELAVRGAEAEALKEGLSHLPLALEAAQAATGVLQSDRDAANRDREELAIRHRAALERIEALEGQLDLATGRVQALEAECQEARDALEAMVADLDAAR